MELNTKLFLAAAGAALAISAFFSFISEHASAARAVSCNPKCGSCSVNVAGSWTYFTQSRDNTPESGPTTLVLNQSGYRVQNTNGEAVTFVGTVFGNSIDFSVAVSGEEIEGYVNFCQGHVLGNKMFAVCDDRDGQRTTFTALRAS